MLKCSVIILLSMVLLSSRAQFLFESEEDYFFESGKLQVSSLGLITNFLSQLVNLQEHTASKSNATTLSSLAKNYYGNESFAIMIARANNQIRWASVDALIPAGISLRLPSVLFCPQFVGIDCILQSYRTSQGISSGNYWALLPGDLKNHASQFMNYPNYVYLVMSLTQDSLLYPATGLTVVVKNLLNYDLIKGQISFKTGFGDSFPQGISTNEEMIYHAYRSDLLQGIHGTLTYSSLDTSASITMDFHIYASNGTFNNSIVLKSGANIFVATTIEGVKTFSLTPEISAQVSISKSPDAYLNLILYNPTKPSRFNGIRKLVPWLNVDNALEVKWNSRGYYQFGVVPKSLGLWQGWSFVATQNAPAENTYLIINANNTFALEIDIAAGNLTLGIPNKSNPNQKWTIITSPIRNDVFMFKGSQNLCLLVNSYSRVPFSDSITNQNMIWLEPCLNKNEEDIKRMTFYSDEYNNYNYDL